MKRKALPHATHKHYNYISVYLIVNSETYLNSPTPPAPGSTPSSTEPTSSSQLSNSMQLQSYTPKQSHIDQSPTDYLPYYKRATALHSLQRHSAALEDYDKVLSFNLSNIGFGAPLQSAHPPQRGTSLVQYIKAKGRDADAVELEKDLDVGEKAGEQVERERRAELWSACAESSTRALDVASFSVDVRAWSVECSFASGDLEGSVGDLTRLTHHLPLSTAPLTHLFSHSYFLLTASHSALKQCLHYDYDSKSCLVLHHLYTNPSTAPLSKSTSLKRKKA
ncbi:hypothetical protein BDQ17DRAFT_1329032 [Cyathus striatus]|nr:hypothetical protein BDQ17DRAFT_1329032 [Cyathus striatus]